MTIGLSDYLTTRLLSVIAAHPWLDAGQAAALAGLGRRKTDRYLDRLTREGLTQTCRVAGLCTHGALYALNGRAAGEQVQVASPAGLEQALLQIESLWGVRNLLVDLARRERLVRAVSPGRLCLATGQKDSLRLDVLAWGELARDGGVLPFVVDWDLGEIVPEAYRQRFETIHRAGRRDGARLPVFVLVTTNRVRAMQLLWLWREAAQSCGACLARFYVAEWSAVIGGRPDVWRRAGDEGTPVPLFHGETGQTDILSCVAYLSSARGAGFSVDRVRAGSSARHELARAHLSVPDRAARRMLRIVGNWPLLSASEIALLLGDRRETHVRPALRRLEELGLVVAYLRLSESHQEPARYYLSALGVRLLAAASGMRPGRYVRYRQWPRRKNKTRDARSAQGLDVSLLIAHFEHTRDVRAFFVALARTARRFCELRQDHALLVWDESDCRRFYHAGGRKHALIPDSGGVYRIGREVYEFFLEVDRGTMSPARLRRKFDAYYAYRQTGEYLRGGTRLPRLLVIVPDEGRAHLVRQVVLERARLAGGDPLDVWVAVQETLNARGPAAPVWRNVVDWKMRCCFAGFERLAQPAPLDLMRL